MFGSCLQFIFAGNSTSSVFIQYMKINFGFIICFLSLTCRVMGASAAYVLLCVIYLYAQSCCMIVEFSIDSHFEIFFYT